jgi:XRE family aerobic/anaerobic benzoate catabolism transcriptional regulator
MRRVVAQGDMRPVTASREAMQDLRNILDGRSAFYSKAAIHVETSGRTLDEARAALLQVLREPLNLPDAIPVPQQRAEFTQKMQ